MHLLTHQDSKTISHTKSTHLEEDTAFTAGDPLPLLRIPVLVLVVGELLVDVLVQHDARVRDVVLGLLRVGGGQRVVLRERGRQAAPDAVGVQLQCQANVVHELPGAGKTGFAPCHGDRVTRSEG